MIDMLNGNGAVWSELDPTREQIADCLEALTEAERFEFGFSAWHETKAWEREARERVARQWSLSMLSNLLINAELDGDIATVSRIKLQIAAQEFGAECDQWVHPVETDGDVKT